jgi:hypothetical protein
VNNPHQEVRMGILEHLSGFDKASQESILDILTNDADLAVRQEATDYLSELQ